MEGQDNQQNPLRKLLSFNSGGTSSHVPPYDNDDSNPFFNDTAGRNGSQWTFLPNPYQNYVEYLTEASSNYLPKTTSDDALGSNYSPVGSIHDVNELSATDRNFFYNDPEKDCGFKLADSSTDIDIRKVRFWRPDNEGEQALKFASTPHHLHAEGPASWTAEPTGDKHNVLQLDPRGTVVAPGLHSPKRKTMSTDRQRRQRIADNLKALNELLPNAAEGSQAYILDDIIDYVKYLKFQIKELSGNRLQDEPTALPLTLREGYGHYINQQMLDEPLEEMMGKLLEEHPVAGAQLLESKGLLLLPMALVADLNQAMPTFGGSAHMTEP